MIKKYLNLTMPKSVLAIGPFDNLTVNVPSALLSNLVGSFKSVYKELFLLLNYQL